MNIFATSSSPVECAQYLDTKRLIKMTLETCQILSTVMHTRGVGVPPYRKTHQNHPVVKWAGLNKANYAWTIEHFKALCKEFTVRRNKTHACEQFIPIFENAISSLPDGAQTPFANCTIFPDETDIFLAYKKHLHVKWKNDDTRMVRVP